MNNQNRVPNNDSRIVNQIDRIIIDNNWSDVSSWADDGSAGVNISGDRNRVIEVCSIIWDAFNGNIPDIGDGVQQGSFWVNADDVSGEIDEFVPMNIGGNLFVEN